MNFNPACAASQRLPQPEHRAGARAGRETRLAGARETELPPPGSCGARSRREPGSAAATLRPWSGHCCPRSALPFRPRATPRRRSPAAVRPGTGHPGAPPPPPGGRPSTRSQTDLRPPRRPGQTSSLPDPPGRAGGRAARSPGFPGLRPQAPSPGAASSLPAPLQPRARAPTGPRASAATKPAAPGRPDAGLGAAAGAPEPDAGTSRPGEGSVRGQRGRGGRRKGRKVSCSRRERLLRWFSPVLARPAAPGRARPAVPVGVVGGRVRGTGDAVAWRASRSLTSVQSERLDHCQCRHVCRGSRSDARLQHQQPLVVRKRGGDWGRGWRGKTERRGRRGEGGKVVVVGEKKAWVGWQPDGDATAPRRADLQLRREAEQVSEAGCIAGSGQEGSALELCNSTPKSAGWVQPVCCSLSTFHSNKMIRVSVRGGGGEGEAD